MHVVARPVLQVPGKKLEEVLDMQRTRTLTRVTLHGALRELGPVVTGEKSTYRKVTFIDTHGGSYPVMTCVFQCFLGNYGL